MSALATAAVSASEALPNSPTTGVQPGDIVRVRHPEHYIVEFARKVKDRDALVLWVGPTPTGMFKGQAKVRFLKRNGRGKEFEEVMAVRDLVRADGSGSTEAPHSSTS